jgi:hypothetical protein
MLFDPASPPFGLVWFLTASPFIKEGIAFYDTKGKGDLNGLHY